MFDCPSLEENRRKREADPNYFKYLKEETKRVARGEFLDRDQVRMEVTDGKGRRYMVG